MDMSEGKKLVARFPDNLHLRAWFIHHMAAENTKEAVAAAEEMVTSPENSVWGWVALASALDRLGKERRDEALLASEKSPGDVARPCGCYQYESRCAVRKQ